MMGPSRSSPARPTDAASAPDPGLAVVATGHIPTLDGWRAVALLMVIFTHQGAHLFGPSGLLPNPALAELGAAGVLGVNIFFGLSGLLICTRLIAERKQTGTINLRAFYIRRLFRIIPPYWTYLLVIGLLGAAGTIDLGMNSYASCFAFLRNYVTERGYAGHYTAHCWSLSVEEHFYLIWPLLLAALAPAARARVAAFGLALLVVAWRALDLRAQIATRSLGLPAGLNELWRTDLSLDGLLFGAWVALLMSDATWRPRLVRWLAPAPWAAIVGMFLAIAVFGVPIPFARTWIALLIPLILAGTALHPRALAGRLLERAPLRWLGRISYSIYLWQQLFLIDLGGFRPLGRLQAPPIGLLCALGCGVLSYHVVEKPMIEFGRRLASRPRPPGSPRRASVAAEGLKSNLPVAS